MEAISKNVNFRKLFLLFALIYFAQGMSGNPGIFNVALKFLLKNSLLLTEKQSAYFFALMTMAWNVKPLYGLISDFLPIFGYRRKSYLIITSFSAFIGLVSIILLQKLSFWVLLIPLMFCSFGLAFSDVLCDALMVEKGQKLNMTGRFQAIQWAAISLASVLVGVGGGYLANYFNYKIIFAIAAIFPFFVFVLSIFFIDEEKQKADWQSFKKTLFVLKSVFKNKNLWIVIGFLFFWNFSPSFGMPMFYYQTNQLKFSKMFIGLLDSISSIGNIIGALIFWKFCREISLKKLLNITIAFGVIGTLAYFGLVGHKSAIIINFIFGITGMIALLTVLDLAAKSCPQKLEGVVFACLMSSLNIGSTFSQFIGGKLFEIVGLNILIIISAVFTALCWIIVPYLKLKN